MAERISERDLILPALWCISKADNKTLSTTDLQQALRQIMQPQGDDLEILAGRNDDKFSQKVRNLRSHKTLENLGVATYKSYEGNGYWTLTEDGEKFLLGEDPKFVDYLLKKDFEYDDVKVALDYAAKSEKAQKVVLFDEDAIVSEGEKIEVSHKVYVRSAKLRDAAIKHYFKGGNVFCFACKFDFEAVYGELGKGFIEIHHMKPVYDYEDADIEETIHEALNNVVPLCSNCHRMIHKRRAKTLLLEELKQIIEIEKKKY